MSSRLCALAARVIVLSLVLFSTSCKKPGAISLPAEPDWDTQPLRTSEKIDIDFYIDASVPIRGFMAETAENQTNYFDELLDKSSGILKAAWPDANIQFWRFGGNNPQPGPPSHDVLGHPGFFTEQQTRIDLAIAHEVPPKPGRSQMKIILTDMFQKANDVDRLATELNSRYLRRSDYAVGVLGVRNAFHGPIYDLSDTDDASSVPVGAADTLPFYLLIAGPVMDVDHAMHVIATRIGLQKGSAQHHFAILYSQRLVNKLSQRMTIDAVDRQPGFTMMSTMVKGASERGMPQIAIPRRDVHLKVTMLKDVKDRDRTDTPLLQNVPAVRPSLINQDGATSQGPAQALEIQDLLAGSDSSGGESFQCMLTIHGRELAPNTVYLVQLDLSAAEGNFEQLRPWYLEISDVPRVLRNKKFDQTKDGTYPGKTPNLRHFLQTIADKTFQSTVPLGRYYIYLRVSK